jgi:hypothetical protein
VAIWRRPMLLTMSRVCVILSHSSLNCFATSLKELNYFAILSNLVVRSSSEAAIFA